MQLAGSNGHRELSGCFRGIMCINWPVTLIFSQVNELLVAFAKMHVLRPPSLCSGTRVCVGFRNRSGDSSSPHHALTPLWQAHTRRSSCFSMCVLCLPPPSLLRCLFIFELPAGNSVVSTVDSLNHFQMVSALLASRKACLGPEGEGLGKHSDTRWCRDSDPTARTPGPFTYLRPSGLRTLGRWPRCQSAELPAGTAGGILNQDLVLLEVATRNSLHLLEA